MIVTTGKRNRSAILPFEAASVTCFPDLPNRCHSYRIREHGDNIGRIPRRGKEQLEVFSTLQRQGKWFLSEALRDG